MECSSRTLARSSSVSNFRTFQANRLKCRYKDADGKNQLVHTLNGSALALPRIVAALLENHQQDGDVVMPKALVPFVGFEKNLILMRAVLLILFACTLFVGCAMRTLIFQLLKQLFRNLLKFQKSTKAFPADSIISVRERLNKAKDDVRWLGIEASVEFVRTDAPIIGKLSEASRYLKRRTITIKWA